MQQFNALFQFRCSNMRFDGLKADKERFLTLEISEKKYGSCCNKRAKIQRPHPPHYERLLYVVRNSSQNRTHDMLKVGLVKYEMKGTLMLTLDLTTVKSRKKNYAQCVSDVEYKHLNIS